MWIGYIAAAQAGLVCSCPSTICTPGLLCGLSSSWVQNSQAAAWLGNRKGSGDCRGRVWQPGTVPPPGRSRVTWGQRHSLSPDNQAPHWGQGQVKAGREHQPTFTGQYENLVFVCLELHVLSVGLVLKFSIGSESKLH